MDGIIGEIRIFAGDYAPVNWAFCNGQEMAVQEHQALFSVISNIYGGDGTTTFKLPDFRGRVVIQQGKGLGLSLYNIGQQVGLETNTMSLENLPAHTHTGLATYKRRANGNNADTSSPINAYLGKANNGSGADVNIYDTDPDPGDQLEMGPQTVDFTVNNNGGSQPINNIQASQVTNYIICLVGEYPSRN